MGFIVEYQGQSYEMPARAGWAMAQQYIERFSGDVAYTSGKLHALAQLQEYPALMQWYSLDDEGKRTFLRYLAMPEDLFHPMMEGLHWLWNH